MWRKYEHFYLKTTMIIILPRQLATYSFAIQKTPRKPQ